MDGKPRALLRLSVEERVDHAVQEAVRKALDEQRRTQERELDTLSDALQRYGQPATVLSIVIQPKSNASLLNGFPQRVTRLLQTCQSLDCFRTYQVFSSLLARRPLHFPQLSWNNAAATLQKSFQITTLQIHVHILYEGGPTHGQSFDISRQCGGRVLSSTGICAGLGYSSHQGSSQTK